MQRRDLIGSLAVLGTVGLAGCANAPDPGSPDGGDGGDDGASDGSDGGSNDGGDEDATTADETTDADRYIAQAVSTLNKVALRLDKLQEKLDTPDEIEIEQETLLDAIDGARSNLDDASETATDEQRAQIETLRNLADVVENLTHVVGTVRDVDPEGVANDTKTAIDDENYDEALSVVRDAKAKASAAEDRTANAKDALEGVDPERLAAVDGVEHAKVEDAVTTTARLTETFERLTVGYEAAIMGAQDLESGRDHSDAREYEAAREDFSEAKTHFESANDALATANEDPPESLADRVEVANCQSSLLLKATEEFESAAEAADDGNTVEAEQHRDDGEEYFEQAKQCGEN